MQQFLGLFSLPHGPKDDERAEKQCKDHYSKTGVLQHFYGGVAERVDEAELGKINRDHEAAAEEHDDHDEAHHDLDHEGLHISGSDGAELDAEKRTRQDDHGKPDIDHAVHG